MSLTYTSSGVSEPECSWSALDGGPNLSPSSPPPSGLSFSSISSSMSPVPSFSAAALPPSVSRGSSMSGVLLLSLLLGFCGDYFFITHTVLVHHPRQGTSRSQSVQRTSCSNKTQNISQLVNVSQRLFNTMTDFPKNIQNAWNSSWFDIYTHTDYVIEWIVNWKDTDICGKVNVFYKERLTFSVTVVSLT